MRTFGYLLLGMVLLAGAVSLAGYRHWWEPEQRARHAASQRGQQAPAARGIGQPAPKTSAPSASTTTSTTSTWSSFETLVNIANLAVGVIGIWMAFVGIRMQRQVMQSQNASRRQ